jgi:hypothetical protein
MTPNADKLLDKARRSASGWRRTELDNLFTAFGFVVEPRTKHDIAFHETYIQLKMMLPRHRSVNPIYVKKAVELIEKLLALQQQDQNKGE